MQWWQQLLSTAMGAVLGGVISLITTQLAVKRQWHQDRRRRVDELSRAAILEVVKLLAEIRDERLDEDHSSESSDEDFQDRVDRMQAWRNAMEIHALCIDNPEFRRRIFQFMDKEFALEWDHEEAVDHLRDCCGALLRDESLPPEPEALRLAYKEITWSFWPDNAFMREDLKRERREESRREKLQRGTDDKGLDGREG
jgi:hypothetical protein